MPPSFVGFGFGPIQSGIFVREACEAGVEAAVVEIDRDLVAAIRAAGGRFRINVAHADGLEALEIAGVRLLDPNDPSDLREIRTRLAAATDAATALPSTAAYAAGGSRSVAAMLAAACARPGPALVVFAAENHADAARALAAEIAARLPVWVARPARTRVGEP